jgi:hypothetical protein
MLVALAFALAASCAHSEPAAKRSVLVLPVSSHWMSASLAEALARSLPDALEKAGFAVTVMASGSPEYQLGISEGWLSPDDLTGDRVHAARYGIAIRTGCDAALTADVTERESETVLQADLAGAVSHKQATVTVTAPVGTKSAGGASRDELAQTLSRDLAAKLTSEIWAEAGADDAGRRTGAPERFADGEKAMAAGRYPEAATEFADALAGQPDNPDYLSAAADAAIARGRATEALPLLKRLSELRVGDKDVLLKAGSAALSAREPEQAEAAFGHVLDSEPENVSALEGMARTVRAEGDSARSETYYKKLLTVLHLYEPTVENAGIAEGMGGSRWIRSPGLNESLPRILAGLRDDGIRFADVQSGGAGLQAARAYLSAGYFPQGLQALAAYQTPDRPAYADQDYLALAADLDKGGEAIAKRVGEIAAMTVRELTGDALNSELESLHDQSDKLATLAERMKVSAKLDPAHRYRVLAYNLLNQSDFEALMYFQTHDPDRKHRSDLLRDAFHKARSQAQGLASDLSGSAGGASGNGPALGG